ncbi:MAG: hypothetical protein U0M06_00740, partial [Clostridia bacterium]|nr:hypothetical protein [Clostridia bacterium]
MEDREIIKCLELCTGKGEVMCNDCPLYDYENCLNETLKQALDLINRQKAENDRLEKEIKRHRAKIAVISFENANLKISCGDQTAEIERLKKDKYILRDG